MVVRAKTLKESVDFGAKLRGWDPNQAPLMDFAFYDPGPLPPAFEDAVEATHCAFAAWKDLAQRDGFGLVAVAVENVNSKGISEGSAERGQIARYRRMLGDLGIPLLDLYTANLLLGNMQLAVFPHDGHWSPEGHRRAAQALFDFLKSGDYLKRSYAMPIASRRPASNVELHPKSLEKDE